MGQLNKDKSLALHALDVLYNQPPNSELLYNNSLLQLINSELLYNNSLLELINSELLYNNSLLQLINSELLYNNSLLELINSELLYNNSLPELIYFQNKNRPAFEIWVLIASACSQISDIRPA